MRRRSALAAVSLRPMASPASWATQGWSSTRLWVRRG